MLNSFIVFGAVIACVLATIAILSIQQIRRRRYIEREILELISHDQYQFTILDVRDSENFRQSHVVTAANIPFSRSKEVFPTENMFERIIVFGPNQRSTQLTARRLSKNGYFNVTYFGAYHHWKGPTSKDV